MNSIVAENKVNVHYSPSALQSIKEKLITIDLINQLDIADGLKELLISNGFTLRLVLKTSTSDLAKSNKSASYRAVDIKIFRDCAVVPARSGFSRGE